VDPEETSIVHFLKPVKISSGTLEALKWLGLLLMTLDHANRILYQGSVIWAYELGRIAWPLFAFVFSYNYAQVEPFQPAFYHQSFGRLLLFGALATPPYMMMKSMDSLIPLNILFTLLAIGACLYFYEEARKINLLSIAIVLVAGVFVEYSWPGILLGLVFWAYCKKTSWLTLALAVLATAFLYVGNDNYWSLAALPIIFLAPYIRIPVPRLRYLFWWFYPLHLIVLLLLRQLIYAR